MAGIGIGSDGLFHQLSSDALESIGMTNEELEELFAKTPEMTKQVQEIQ